VYASRTLALPLPSERIRRPIPEHHSNRAAIDFVRDDNDDRIVNEPVRAVEGGKVTHINTVTCGTGVQIDNGTHSWLYCHLSNRYGADGQEIANGAMVTSGVLIGRSGGTGFLDAAGTRPVAPHLHLQVRIATAAQRQCEPRPSCLPPTLCPHPIIEALMDGRPPPRVEDLPGYPCARPPAPPPPPTCTRPPCQIHQPEL
jgi:murein DD-endopeptidase MepM/ murein hydrolase activator NlpD